MSILETSGPFYPGYGLRRGHVEGVLLGLVLFFVLMREPPVHRREWAGWAGSVLPAAPGCPSGAGGL